MKIRRVRRELSRCDSRQRYCVMRVYDDLRAKAGVVRVTEYERRCGLCEQGVIKRKLILIDAEVCDRFLTEALIENVAKLPDLLRR
jgi:hypothetical protein